MKAIGVSDAAHLTMFANFADTDVFYGGLQETIIRCYECKTICLVSWNTESGHHFLQFPVKNVFCN